MRFKSRKNMILYNTEAQIPVLPSIPKGKAGIFAISPFRVGAINGENLVYQFGKLLFIFLSLIHY